MAQQRQAGNASLHSPTHTTFAFYAIMPELCVQEKGTN